MTAVVGRVDGVAGPRERKPLEEIGRAIGQYRPGEARQSERADIEGVEIFTDRDHTRIGTGKYQVSRAAPFGQKVGNQRDRRTDRIVVGTTGRDRIQPDIRVRAGRNISSTRGSRRPGPADDISADSERRSRVVHDAIGVYTFQLN
ncbi:hypothetical protein LA76x_0523 [Lysobacter antibioticus]|uniref:Uncharacterized protein n=1 Tax=Lysobacter antibioticus TaxID=84531 RepID=A0A0S2F566_LYSAN|nr:hypothetical protein LA76x_0523 [Lysobacter antibioticus]